MGFTTVTDRDDLQKCVRIGTLALQLNGQNREQQDLKNVESLDEEA